MKRIFTLLTFFISTLSICTLSVAEGYAQLTGDNYPVQAHVYVQQPSLKMPEYFTSSRMLSVDLILKHLTKTTLDVYLGWQITGLGLGLEAGTLPGFVPPNYLSLTKGSKRNLKGTDLREYFQPGMLAISGVGENVIFNGKLPEGFYTLKITAYEAGTGRQVSNTAETYFSVAYALPPVINLPLVGSEQPVTRPQSVLLQWMPRHTAAGSNRITYSGKVCEVAEDEDPNVAINGSQNCFTIPAQQGTSYLLKASDLPLKTGKRYAFQVQAADINEQLEFQNQGYSEVSWFRFGEACKPPTGLQINAIAAGRLNVSWNAFAQAAGYKLLYRSKNQTEWTEQTTLGTSVSLVSLNPELDYEFKVITVCEPGNESPESETVTWEGEGETDQELEDLIKKVLNPEGEPIVGTGPGIERTVPRIQYAVPSDPLPETFEDLIPKDPAKIPCKGQVDTYENCADEHPSISVDASGKDPDLKVGDLVAIYDYLVVLTQINSSNPFSGKGLAQMSFLNNAKVPVEFSNVLIKQKDLAHKGGCVTAVNGYFRVRTGLTPEQIKQEEIDLIHTVRTNTDSGSIYISRRQIITELDTELKTTGKDLCEGKLITNEAKQSLLNKHKLAIQGLQDWADDVRDVYSELDLDGQETLSRIQAMLTTLETNISTIESGQGCPENPDIKAEMETITEKIKEHLNGNPEKEENDSPLISSIEVKNITSSTATISWKGDKRFIHYIVTYQKPGEGIVTKIVGKESALSLTGLEKDSFYYFSIRGINEDGSEFVVPERIFSTLDNDFPKPKNIVPENLDEKTVKLTWDKELMHKSYKLTYTDTNGEQRFAYPTTNQIVLNDIHPDMKYTFELTGIGSQNQTASEYGDFGRVYCNIIIDNKISIAYSGEEVILRASCIKGEISWNKPGWINTQRTIFGIPVTRSELKINLLETTTFTAVCKVENADGIRYCTAETEIKVYPQECKEFKIFSKKTSYKLGQIITLTAEGCDGEIFWPKFNKTGNSIEFVFTEKGDYQAECKNENLNCKSEISLERECYIPISITKRKRDTIWSPFKNKAEVNVNIRVDFGEIIQTKIIEGKCNWSCPTGAAKEHIGVAKNFDTNEVTILVEVKYFDGTVCEETFKISKPVMSCNENSFDIGYEKIGNYSVIGQPGIGWNIVNGVPQVTYYFEKLKLYTTGNKCNGNIEWTIGDRTITSNSEVIVNYSELPARITAKCLNSGCFTFRDIYHMRNSGGVWEFPKACVLEFERLKYHSGYFWSGNGKPKDLTPIPKITENIYLPTLPADANIPNVVEVQFYENWGMDGNHARVIYKQSGKRISGYIYDEPISVEYNCSGASSTITIHPPGSIPDGQKCVEITTQKKVISLGEQANLEVKGCIQGIKWFKNRNEANITTRIFSDLPNQVGEETYSVSCEFPQCNAEVKIKVNPCSFKVSANKKEVKPFELATLKSEGCTGQVEWSDESGILSISEGETLVQPARTTIYYAKCVDRPLCTAEIEIKVKTSLPPKPECEDFIITVAENPGQECKGLTLNSTGCKQGTITWKVGSETVVKGEKQEVKFTITGGSTVVNASCKKPAFPPVESTLEVPTQLCLDASASPSEIQVNKQSTVTLSHKNCSGTVVWENTETGEIELFSYGSISKTISLDKPRKYEVTCSKDGYISKKQTVNIIRRVSPQDPSAYIDTKSACSKKGISKIELCDNNNCKEVNSALVPSIQIEKGRPNTRYSIKVYSTGCSNSVWDWSSAKENFRGTGSIFQFYPTDQGWVTLNCDGCVSGSVVYVNVADNQNGNGGSVLFNCNNYKNKDYIFGSKEGIFSKYANYNECPYFRGTTWYDKDPSKNSNAIIQGYGSSMEFSGSSAPRVLYSACLVNGNMCVAEVEINTISNPNARVKDGDVLLAAEEVEFSKERLANTNSSNSCDPTTAVPLKSLMAQYVSHLICEYIYALANQEGEFVESRAREFYASLKTNLAAAYPQYAANFVFDKTESEVVELLRQAYQSVKSGAGHNCAEGDEIVSGFTGDITYGDYENVRQKYDDVTDEMADDLTPSDIRISTETTQPSCGLPDGSIIITATGGTEPYSYSIDNGVTFTLNKTLFDKLTAGKYTVVVKDADGNEGRKTVELEAAERYVTPASPVITAAMPNARVVNTSENSFCIAYSPTNVSYCYTFKIGFEFERPQAINDWTLKIKKVPERFSSDLIGDYLPLFNQDQPDRFLGFYKAGSHPPATCTELNGEGEIGGQCIGLLCKELLLPDDVFRNSRIPGLFMEDHLSGHYAPEVSELVEEIDEIITRLMNAGQYKELIHDKKAGTYTAEELQSMKQILLDYEEAAKQAYGEASSTTFAYLIDFFKCKDTPNICSTDGVLPHCWWQFTLNGNTAFSAGIFDGIGDLVELAVDLNRFSSCWLSASGYLWDTDNSCAATRQSTMEAVKFTWELSSGNPETIAQVALISALAGDKIWDDLGIWANEAGLCTNRPEVCCAYTKGKLAFDIASLFVGAGEFKVAGKISGLGAKTLQMMTSLIGGLGKTKFPAKVLSLQAIRNTAGKGLSHLMLMASLSGNPTAVATGVRVLANEAKTTTTWVATTAGRMADNSTTVLARAIEQSADNAGAKLVAEVDEIILLLDDVPQNLNKLNAFQLADNIVFAKETTNGLEAIFAFTAAGLVKIPPKDNNPVECEFCSPSKSLSKRLCDKLEELKTKGGANGATGVQKLCSSLGNTQLEAVADELLLTKYSIAEVTAFMGDISEAPCGGASYLCENVSGLTVSVIEAWKIVFDAKGTLNYKKDFKLLQEVASIQANGTLMQTLGGESVLTDIIRKNENAPCNTCQNNKTWLNDMTEYLKDVTYFVSTFGKNTGGNRSAMVFSSGITSGNKGHVIGAVYMLKVLRNDPSIRPSSFEGALNGPLANCEPDAVSGNKIFEFKSWSPNAGDTDIGSMGDDEDYATIGGSSAFLKLANNSYASSPNSYTQFVCYLSNASSIANLEYVFDKDLLNVKGQNNAEAYVKNMFRELLLKPQEQQQIFNAIWANTNGLPQNLFGQNIDLNSPQDRADALEEFKILINDHDNKLFGFVKVK